MLLRASVGGRKTGIGDRAHERPSAGRGVGAAALSLLLPGAGQLWVGRWHRGGVLVAVSLAMLALGVAASLSQLGRLASHLLRPGVLEALLILNVAVLAFRGFAMVDAYRCGRQPPRGTSRRSAYGPHRSVAVPAAAAALTLAAVVPHAAVAYYGLEARATLRGVFQPPTEEAAAAAAPAGGPRSHDAAWKDDGRLTVLLLGSDAGPQRRGTRTDTIIVATTEAPFERAALISIPRNLVGVPLPAWVPSDRRCRCFPGPINGLYAHFRDRTDLVSEGVDPGAAVLRGALEQLLGLRIDHHAIADLRGFVRAIDALGGVTVDVPRRVRDQLDSPDEGQWDAIDLRPGRHHLDGRQALVYVRSRRGGDDYERMARQRCFIRALLDQTDAADILRAFPRLASIVRRSVSTDVPHHALPEMVQLATAVDTSAVEVLSVIPPDLARRDGRGYPVADRTRVRAAVRHLLGGGTERVAAVASARESTTRVTPAPAPPSPQPLSRACRP